MEANVAGLEIVFHPQNRHRYWHRIFNTEHSKKSVIQPQSTNVCVNKSSKVDSTPFLKGNFRRVILHLFLHPIFVVKYRIQINFTERKKDEDNLKTVLD